MQISTKFITDNAVTDAKVRLTSTGFLRSRNASNTGDVNLIRANGSDQIELGGDTYLNNFQLKSVADPTASSDAATKSYVDSVAQGLSPKAAADLASTGALAANTYNNGTAGVGATLTGNANGALSVDGTVVTVGMRILVKNEVAGAHNGIYSVTQVGSGGTPYILTRTTDADSSSKLHGASLFVIEGSANADTQWVLTSPPGAIVIGTDAIVFSPFGTTLSAGNGIDITSNVVSVKLLSSSGLKFSGSSLSAAVQGPGTLNTTDFDGSGNIKALKAKKETFTLSGTDITNQYVDLANVAHTDSVCVQPVGGMPQQEGQDYSLSYSGGAGGKTRVTFLNGLATGGASALVASDVLLVGYETL